MSINKLRQEEFDKASDISNTGGVKLLYQYIPLEWKVDLSGNKMSPEDATITTTAGDKIVVEFKLRDRLYSTILLEDIKLNGLKRRREEEEAVDALYLSYTKEGDSVLFSFNKLNEFIREKGLNNMVYATNDTIHPSKTYYYKGKIVRCKSWLRETTVWDSGMKLKDCWYLPQEYRVKTIVEKNLIRGGQ